jgi:hypothetical protein
MKLVDVAWMVVLGGVVAVACKGMLPDYHEVTVSHGDGDIDHDKNTLADYDSSETVVAYTMGWAPGDRARHRDLIREQERNYKRMIAAQDRAQLAFLTGKPQEEKTDITGDPVDVLTGYLEPPKTMNEALIGLISAISLALVGFTVYWLRKQNRRRNGDRQHGSYGDGTASDG